MSFRYVDLFAGIGGFHGALSALGGTCVYASEIDRAAARVYLRNWGVLPEGDITLAANDFTMDIPEHDVLVGGFPCQPFSKSGKQLGMEEARGTLFWNIAKIIEVRKPKLVLLENVRNISGPRHIQDWKIIINTIRDLGYRVSNKPFVVSPHQIHPAHGGRPQHRERVLICATLIPKGFRFISSEPGLPDVELIKHNWSSENWNFAKDLPLEESTNKEYLREFLLSDQEKKWIEVWSDFVQIFQSKKGSTLPGFPLWVDYWKERSKIRISRDTPEWKKIFILKNINFYLQNKKAIDSWLKKWDNLEDFPASRRKFEWQAKDAKSLKDTLIHFRPSGVRCKVANYAPTLVAITQTTILPKKNRKLTVREAARLQGFPDWFDFAGQSSSASYRQLGNAVNIGVVYNVLRSQVVRDLELLGGSMTMAKSILAAPDSPDAKLQTFEIFDEMKIDISESSSLKIVYSADRTKIS